MGIIQPYLLLHFYVRIIIFVSCELWSSFADVFVRYDLLHSAKFMVVVCLFYLLRCLEYFMYQSVSLLAENIPQFNVLT